MARVGQKYRIFDCTQTALDVIQSFLTNLELIQTFLGEIESSLQDAQSSLDELTQVSNKLKHEVLQLSKQVCGVNLKEVEITKRRETNKQIRETLREKERPPKEEQPPKEKNFTYVSDFDENGIMYWLGTNGKTTPYVNPCTIPAIANATESYSAKGNGNIAFGRTAGSSNYIPDANHPGWFQIEFKSVNVLPTHYSIQTDSNGNYSIRNWKFEGSIDGKAWTVISSHVADSKIPNTANSCGSWPVQVAGIKGGFKFLRVSQTGVNSRGDHNFMMCGFEVYGTMYPS